MYKYPVTYSPDFFTTLVTPYYLTLLMGDLSITQFDWLHLRRN